MNLPIEAQWALAALLGLVVGLLVMWLIMRQSGGQKKQHQALVEKFSDYRQEVDKHFVETAAAVDELNRSYQKVVQHLSSGAQSLMGKEALQEQLAKRSDKSMTVAYLAATDIIPVAEDHNTVAEAQSTVAEPTQIAVEEDVPPPPFTDATEAEVVPLSGQPDRVADRKPSKQDKYDSRHTVATENTTAKAKPVEQVDEAVDLQQPKP